WMDVGEAVKGEVLRRGRRRAAEASEATSAARQTHVRDGGEAASSASQSQGQSAVAHAERYSLNGQPRFRCNRTAFPAAIHTLSTDFHQPKSCSLSTLHVFHFFCHAASCFLRLSFPLCKLPNDSYSFEELKNFNRHFRRRCRKGGPYLRDAPAGIFGLFDPCFVPNQPARHSTSDVGGG
ncbi:MAG: hypothetical protein KGJ51_05045, partial [Acidobacteriota bacterium]|nr:hypothetical protein [Acidobacteriota bacterium]